MVVLVAKFWTIGFWGNKSRVRGVWFYEAISLSLPRLLLKLI